MCVLLWPAPSPPHLIHALHWYIAGGNRNAFPAAQAKWGGAAGRRDPVEHAGSDGERSDLGIAFMHKIVKIGNLICRLGAAAWASQTQT